MYYSSVLQGKAAFEKLKGEFPDERVLLSQSNLRRLDIQGFDMSGGDLGFSNLRGTNASGAVFSNATLVFCDCSGLNLRGARLQNADMRGAKMRGADVRKADMRGVIVRTVESTDSNGKIKKWAVNLSHVRGMTQSQLDSMIGDQQTIIPDGLKRPEAWLAPEAIEELSLSHLEQALALEVEHEHQAELRDAQPQFELVAKTLLLSIRSEVDEELRRLKTRNFFEDDLSKAENDRQITFLANIADNTAKMFEVVSADPEEAGDPSVFKTLLKEYGDEVLSFLAGSKGEFVEGGVRLSLIATISALAGVAGYVVPIAAVAYFGGDKIRSLIPDVTKLRFPGI